MSRQVYGYSKEEKIKDLNKRMLLAYENDDTSHAPELKKMKILIIDDNQNVREVLSELLTLEGQEAVTVESGQKGLEMVEKNKFDLVFLDLAMPGFSGFQVIDSLAKTGNIKLNKIVIITAMTISNTELNALSSKGVYRWMRKPFDIDELKSILRSISPG